MWLRRPRATTALLSYVSDEEVVLRGIPSDTSACVILHPPAADSPAVAAHLTELAHERRQLHRKWYFVSWAALSVTIPLMIIPIVPAVPFYWVRSLVADPSSCRCMLALTHAPSTRLPAELLPYLGQQEGMAGFFHARGVAGPAGICSTTQAMHAHARMRWQRVLQSFSRRECSWGRPLGCSCV